MYGDFNVSKVAEEFFPAYVERTFSVVNMVSQERREVVQLQFTNWPDHGAPDNVTDMIDFVFVCESFDPSHFYAIIAETRPANTECSIQGRFDLSLYR